MSDPQAAPEPVFDKRDQFQQVQDGLLDGEVVYAVYDAIGAGTGFVGITDRRVILQDKSFVGKRFAITSIPYGRIISVSVVSDRTWTGGFFSTSTVAIATSEGVHEIDFRGNEKAHHAHNLILWHMVR